MRLFLASVLSVVALSCSSSQELDEVVVPGKEASVTGPVEVDGGEVVLDLSTPEKVVYQALRAARTEDVDVAWEAYVRVVHPDVVNDEVAVKNVREVVWPRFRKQVDWYVRSRTDVLEYVMKRHDPVADDVVEVVVEVRDLVNDRYVPVVVRRHGKEWRIVSNPM